MSTTATPLVGGRYEFVRTLGRGSFGHTFLARDIQADRLVAIKVLDAAKDLKALELFRRESEVLRGLRHHGIPEVHDSLSEVWNGSTAAFLVMEYIEGTALSEVIENRQPIEPDQVLHVFLELLGILDYLHSRVPPILHRDIKPSNIILRPSGFPSLVDFGSVRRVFLAPEESGSTVAGTYGYMPYEQYMGQASPSSDLYALGATFLHLLTGRPPRDFVGDEGSVRVPDTLPGDPRLKSALVRMLRSSPAERFTGARDVRSAVLGGGALVAVTPNRLAAGVPEELVTALPSAPRDLKGPVKDLMKRASPGTLRLMYASEKHMDFNLFDVLSLAFFSVITAGLLPMIFANMASARRRRMRRFFQYGQLATAEIMKIETEKLPFDERISRVSYEFEVDGRVHRDADTVLLAIANRWQPGDRVPVLFLPDRGYDSVIIAVE